MSEEMICKNCKYHYIEEISFDYPQSCCRKASGTTEQWCKCNNFEYGDRYIEQLQQENKELHNKIDEISEFIKENKIKRYRPIEGEEYDEEIVLDEDDITCLERIINDEYDYENR